MVPPERNFNQLDRNMNGPPVAPLVLRIYPRGNFLARNPNPGFEIAATLTELIQKGRTLAERNQYQYEPPPDESMPDKSDKEDILHTPYKTKKK